MVFLLLPENSRGRADIIVETNDKICVLEFKLDGTAAEALKQIEDKGYAEPYAADPRKLFKVGVGFSSEKKNIVEWEVEGYLFAESTDARPRQL